MMSGEFVRLDNVWSEVRSHLSQTMPTSARFEPNQHALYRHVYFLEHLSLLLPVSGPFTDQTILAVETVSVALRNLSTQRAVEHHVQEYFTTSEQCGFVQYDPCLVSNSKARAG